MSKTQAALALVAQGMLAIEAAKSAGITPPTLYAALGRMKKQAQEGKERCPCCGQVVREGFSIDSAVLKTQPDKA